MDGEWLPLVVEVTGLPQDPAFHVAKCTAEVTGSSGEYWNEWNWGGRAWEPQGCSTELGIAEQSHITHSRAMHNEVLPCPTSSPLGSVTYRTAAVKMHADDAQISLNVLLLATTSCGRGGECNSYL